MMHYYTSRINNRNCEETKHISDQYLQTTTLTSLPSLTDFLPALLNYPPLIIKKESIFFVYSSKIPACHIYMYFKESLSK